MGNNSSRNTYKTHSYHIQKEISTNNFFLVWPTHDFSDYCFQIKLTERELQKLKLQDPNYSYRIIKCEVKVVNGKVNKTGRFEVIRTL